MNGGSHIVAVGTGTAIPQGSGDTGGEPAGPPLSDTEPFADEQIVWEEADPASSEPSAWAGWLSPAVAVIAGAGWTAFFVWARWAEISAGLSASGWTGLAAQWATPMLLVCVLLLLVMRSSAREYRRFGDAARLLSTESAGLERRLRTVNRELSLAREFLASEARDLEALGRMAGERLTGHARRLEELVGANQSRVETIGEVSEAALLNMEKLREQLPVIAGSAKDVTNNIGNAGRAAHGQLEEMVKGFKRINEFGQACEQQVLQLRTVVDDTLERFSCHGDLLEGQATARFAELGARANEMRADAEQAEIAALASMRERMAVLAAEIGSAREELGSGEQQCIAALQSRLSLLRDEGGTIAQTLREGEEQAMDGWRSGLAQLGEDRASLLADMEQAAQAVMTAAQERFTAIASQVAQFETDIGERARKLDDEAARRRNEAYRAEEQAIARFDQLVARIDSQLAEQAARHEKHGEHLLNHSERLAGRLAEYDSRLESLTVQANENESRMAGAVAVLAGRIVDTQENLSDVGKALERLTERSVRLLELLQASAQQTGTKLPEAITQCGDGLTSLESRLASLASAIGETGAQSTAIADQVATAAGGLTDMAQTIAGVIASIEESGTAHDERLNALLERLRTIEERNHEIAGKTQGELRDAITALETAASAATSAIGEHSAAEVAALAHSLGAQSAEAIEKAIRLCGAEASGQLEQAAAHAAGVGREAAIQLRDQLGKVNELVANLETRIEQARTRAEERVDNDFARRVALITESLNSNAIDIAKALSTEVSDTAWAGYLRGDRGIFTRRAVSLLDATEARAIHQVFERDPGFREHVNRYVHDFEAILREVLSTRDGHALGVTLLSSDMGKLYVALAQAIERLRG